MVVTSCEFLHVWLPVIDVPQFLACVEYFAVCMVSSESMERRIKLESGQLGRDV